MPDRSKVMTQTKRDALALQVGGWARCQQRLFVKTPMLRNTYGRDASSGDNIRMDLQEVGLGYEDWIGRAQDRDRWRALVSAVMNLRVP